MKEKSERNVTKFKTQFTKGYKGSAGESNFGVSQTVPDQTIPLRKLLDNHSRGIPSPGATMYEPQYFNTEVPRMDMDINELQEMRLNLEEEERAIKQQIEAEKAAKEAAREQKKLKEALRAELQEKTQQSSLNEAPEARHENPERIS